MLSFFYIFALLNLCIKAEVCSIITISDSDGIIINKDSPFVGFDKSFFSGYNGCYYRDTLDGYIMYFRNPDDLISPGLGVTRNTAGLKWRLNDYKRIDVNSTFRRSVGNNILFSSENDVSKNVQDITSWSISINVTCGCNFFTTSSPTPLPTLPPDTESNNNKTIIIVVVTISIVVLLLLCFFIMMRFFLDTSKFCVILRDINILKKLKNISYKNCLQPGSNQ